MTFNNAIYKFVSVPPFLHPNFFQHIYLTLCTSVLENRRSGSRVLPSPLSPSPLKTKAGAGPWGWGGLQGTRLLALILAISCAVSVAVVVLSAVFNFLQSDQLVSDHIRRDVQGRLWLGVPPRDVW